ncbi:MAG TPA: ATP-binding protein [Ignavibacteria bacterium]|nr:ATP-binding protein [Ignavibacteria bacterium]
MNNPNKILLASSTKNLAVLRNFIESRAVAFGFDESSIYQIILSVDEACTNIIKHAHKYNDKENIEVETQTEKGQFKIIMKYKGNGFNPNELHNPDMKDYFDKFKVGGLGVPIMKKFMNKIEYVHKNSDYNSLTLIKFLQN